ncbi:YidC/Oxa1 family membrane protein insertase [Aquihabitans sp. McL0605]|uniref:YidC/Oxa1 family membrane protein insertase n=1 Tax=Aquihabitans sp. McL0605 TaxID=3415671 RepID=UPI003CEC4399
MYNLIAKPLEFFYGLYPNYAVAISLLTLSIMILLLPLTLKGTRSMLAMQKLQPELKKIQNKYKDDRQKLNEEMMAFYKENNINPVSGCLPLLLQMPVFIILYRTLFQLLNRAPYGYDMGAASVRSTTGINGGAGVGIWEKFGWFRPNHISHTSQLYIDLSHTRVMEAWGLNLAESAQKALRQGYSSALPYILLVLAVTATSYIQQKQVSGRNTATPVNPQQQMLMRIMPLFFAFISFTLPAGIVVYFLVSNLFRVGQQALITRTMYRDDDAPVATTGRETAKSSIKSDEVAEKPKGFLAQIKEIGLPNPAEAKREAQSSKSSGTSGNSTNTSKNGASSTKSSNSAPSAKSSTAGPSRAAPTAANRSKSKKKRK